MKRFTSYANRDQFPQVPFADEARIVIDVSSFALGVALAVVIIFAAAAATSVDLFGVIRIIGGV